MSAQAVICDLTVMFQYHNSFLYLNINPAAMLDRLQVVFVYYIL